LIGAGRILSPLPDPSAGKPMQAVDVTEKDLIAEGRGPLSGK
jgi:hypothetical protein